MAFEDVLWIQGSDNMAGLSGDIFFVPKDDVDETALLALSLDADGVTLSSNIPLVALKKFFRIYHTRGTGKITDQVVGERDAKSFENMAEFKFPGDTKALVAFKRQVLNTPGVYIARDANGKYRLFGITTVKDGSDNDVLTLDFPAYIESASGDTGAGGGDAKGHNFQVKTAGVCPPLFYEGTIDVDAGT